MPPPEPYTVLYLDNSHTWGGAINVLVHLVHSLDRSFVDPVVVSAQPVQFLEEAFQGVKIRPFRTALQWEANGAGTFRRVRSASSGVTGRAVDHGRAAYWLFRHHLPAAFKIARLAKETGADLIHLNNNAASQIDGIIAARMLGIPCVAHAQGPQKSRWFLRRMARIPVAHVAISEEIRENVLSLGVEPDRTVLIYPGIDLSDFEATAANPGLRRELGLAPGTKTFALFGRLVPWKGTLEFVEAAARVLTAMPDVVALVVGDVSDGETAYAAAVEERIAHLGLADRIILTGFRDDIPELMRLVDCAVHASIDPEPFGLVVVEAMAVGTPVVAADTGGPRETVVPGETGFLADPRDPDAMASAILRILRDPGLARRMGQEGAARARRVFSKERYAKDVEALYKSILSGAFPPTASR